MSDCFYFEDEKIYTKMKKTLSVNLGGTVFHIDEDAYQELMDYLQDVKHHLGDGPSSEEVLNDIEQRISELFIQWMQGHREVITKDDVVRIIGILGRPEQYDNEEESSEERRKAKSSDQTSSQDRRCAGPRRRLYRDTENAVLGGVCSGLGIYLNVNAVLLRLMFFLLFWFGGSGILLYIVCWIIIPEAKTAAQRLEMEGEDVTIDNIEKKVREEYGRVKDRVGDYVNSSRFERDARTAGNGFVRFLSVIGKVLFAFIAAIVGICGFSAVVALVFALIGLLAGNVCFAAVWPQSLWPLQQIFSYPPLATLMTVGLILTIGIPVIAIFKVLFARTLNVRPSPKWLLIVGSIFWLVGIALCICSCVHAFALGGGSWI
jgi:phage shock protein PspC (stress-responsive transcriptional regulator)